MRWNNRHFSRATVFHVMIPGHHLQFYMLRATGREEGLLTHRSGLRRGPCTGEFVLWGKNFY